MSRLPSPTPFQVDQWIILIDAGYSHRFVGSVAGRDHSTVRKYVRERRAELRAPRQLVMTLHREPTRHGA